MSRTHATDASGKEAGSSKAVSILASHAEEVPAVTCKEKFVKFVKCCFASSAPILQGAIAFGKDAASQALNESIQNNKKLTDAQKTALTGITDRALAGLQESITTQIKAHASSADPRLKGLLDATVSSGLVGAFVSEDFAVDIREAAESEGEGESVTHRVMMPAVPITTHSKLKAAIKTATSAKSAAVIDLSEASSALALPDLALKNMVKTAVRSSPDIPPKLQKLLLKTGAASAFAKLLLDSHNKRLAETAAASHHESVLGSDSLETHADAEEKLDDSVVASGDVHLAGDLVSGVDVHA